MENKYFTLKISKELWRIVFVSSIVPLVIILGLTFYVNHYMPHGRIIDLEKEAGCEPDPELRTRNQCYQEDMTNLDIPEWAKGIRVNWLGIVFLLGFVSVVAYSKSEDKNPSNKNDMFGV